MNRIWTITCIVMTLLGCEVPDRGGADYVAQDKHPAVTDRAYTISLVFSIGPFAAAQCPHNYSYVLEFRSDTVAARRSAVHTTFVTSFEKEITGDFGGTFPACYDQPVGTSYGLPSMVLTEEELNSPGGVFMIIAYRSKDSSQYGGSYTLTDGDKRELAADDGAIGILGFSVRQGDGPLDNTISAKILSVPIEAAQAGYTALNVAVTYARQVHLSDQRKIECVSAASSGTPCYLAVVAQGGLFRMTSIVPVIDGVATWARDEVIDVRMSSGTRDDNRATTYQIVLMTAIENEITVDEDHAKVLANCSVLMSAADDHSDAPYSLNACRETVGDIKDVVVQTSVYRSVQATEPPLQAKPQAKRRPSK